MNDEPLNPAWDPIVDGRADLMNALKSLHPHERLRQVGTMLVLSGYGFDAARAWLIAAAPGDLVLQHKVSEAWHGIDFEDGQWWH